MEMQKDGSLIVLSEDGTDEEPSYALPLTEGELYPLELIPIRKVQHYNSEQQVYVEKTTKPSNTLKSVLLEEPSWLGYQDCL